MYNFVDSDIVVYSGVISRYSYFKILRAEDSNIRQATKEEVELYYKNWDKTF